jgi:hypothetical protein
MAIDAKDDEFDHAMLFSNDSDMAFSIQGRSDLSSRA